MEKIAIITDSTADLTKDLRKKDNIYVIPLYVNIGGKYLKDGIDIKTDEIIEYNEKNPDNLAKSSAPSPGDVKSIIGKARADGFDKIFVVTVSSRLSATFSIFKIEAEDDSNIKLIDSKSASLGETLLVGYIQSLIGEGYSFDQISGLLDGVVDKKSVYIWVDSLESLKAGGRLSTAALKTVKFFNIKPILNLGEDGKVGIIKLKAKEDKAIKDIVKKIREDLKDSEKYYLAIGHGGDEKLLKKIEKEASDLIDGALSYKNNYFGSVIRVHSGKKAFAIFCQKIK